MVLSSIIEKFVNVWKIKDEVEGILLTGSYAYGLPKKESDIDFRIILSNNGPKFLKGARIIDEKQVSFVGSSVNEIYKMFENQMLLFSKFQVRVFCSGIILFDKNGELKQLKKKAKSYLNKSFRKIDDFEIELESRVIYKLKKELNFKKGYEFNLNYYLFLQRVLNFHSKMLGIEIVHANTFKLNAFFFDEEFRKRYLINKFPDKDFVSLFVAALKIKSIKGKNQAINEIWNLISRDLKLDFDNYIIIK